MCARKIGLGWLLLPETFIALAISSRRQRTIQELSQVLERRRVAVGYSHSDPIGIELLGSDDLAQSARHRIRERRPRCRLSGSRLRPATPATRGAPVF